METYEIEVKLKEKCWQITSFILSRYDFDKLSHPWNEHWSIFENQLTETFEDNYFKEFLELAVLMRASLDIHDVRIPKKIGEVEISVGDLIKVNSSGEKTIPLTFREACNKTIHALEYEIILDRCDSHPLDNGKNGYSETEETNFKNPILLTKGSFQGDNWTAKIELLKFIDQALSLW